MRATGARRATRATGPGVSHNPVHGGLRQPVPGSDRPFFEPGPRMPSVIRHRAAPSGRTGWHSHAPSRMIGSVAERNPKVAATSVSTVRKSPSLQSGFGVVSRVPEKSPNESDVSPNFCLTTRYSAPSLVLTQQIVVSEMGFPHFHVRRKRFSAVFQHCPPHFSTAFPQ